MLDQENSQRVIVQDIHMPFLSMVVFMVKWAIAAIPAFLILIILGVLTSGIVGGFLRDKTVVITYHSAGTVDPIIGSVQHRDYAATLLESSVSP